MAKRGACNATKVPTGDTYYVALALTIWLPGQSVKEVWVNEAEFRYSLALIYLNTTCETILPLQCYVMCVLVCAKLSLHTTVTNPSLSKCPESPLKHFRIPISLQLLFLFLSGQYKTEKQLFTFAAHLCRKTHDQEVKPLPCLHLFMNKMLQSFKASTDSRTNTGQFTRKDCFHQRSQISSP